MLSELQKALVVNQKVQITVWDPQDENVEHTFPSYIQQAGERLFSVAPPTADQMALILPLLQKGSVVGLVVETYPNPYIFYPTVHVEPSTANSAFWLTIPENPQIEVIQRRRHVRVPMVMPFELEYLISDRWLTLSARTEDISGGGIRFTSVRLFPKEQELVIKLPLNLGKSDVRLKAKTIFSTQNRAKKQPDDLYVTACQFVALDDAQETALMRECFRRQLGLKQ